MDRIGLTLDIGIGPGVLDEVERAVLEAALIYVDWNQARASRLLGVSRQTVARRMAVHNMETPDKFYHGPGRPRHDA